MNGLPCGDSSTFFSLSRNFLSFALFGTFFTVLNRVPMVPAYIRNCKVIALSTACPLTIHRRSWKLIFSNIINLIMILGVYIINIFMSYHRVMKHMILYIWTGRTRTCCSSEMANLTLCVYSPVNLAQKRP